MEVVTRTSLAGTDVRTSFIASRRSTLADYGCDLDQRAAWQFDACVPACSLCARKFNLFYRRHHCRGCGKICCAACCTEKVRGVAGYGDSAQRVCKRCLGPCDVTESAAGDDGARREAESRRSALLQRSGISINILNCAGPSNADAKGRGSDNGNANGGGGGFLANVRQSFRKVGL